MKYKIAQYKYFREKYNNEIQNSNRLTVDLNTALNNAKFMEQLYIASDNLYEMILKFKKNPDQLSLKEKRHLQESVDKYYLRSKFRSTPFGLFSQVSNLVNTSPNKKELNIGFRWFYCVIQKLVKKYPEKFEYIFENGLSISHNVISFFNQTNNITDSKNNIQINDTKLVELLRKFCNRSRSLEEIKLFIKSKYEDVDNDYIEKYILNLINKKILRATAYPSLDESQDEKLYVLTNLYNNLGLKKIAVKVRRIRDLINKYNISEVGSGISILSEIRELMNSIESVQKEDIDVDLYKKRPSINIAQSTIKNVEKMVELLSKISLPSSPLYEYIFNFVDKFGTNTEVPLGILINKNTGIGLPKMNSKDDPKLINIQKSITDYFDNKIERAILTSKDVVIDENDSKNVSLLENLNDERILFSFPTSFDICLNLNNQGAVSIAEIQGSDHPYSMIGRFRNLDSMAIKEFFDSRSKAVDQCDLNVLPTKLELGNITNNKHYNQLELSVGVNGHKNKRQVNLDDILVGVEEKSLKLYLRLRNSDKKIIFIDNNMLNNDLKHPIVKLLLDISNQADKWWFNYPWKELSENQAYIPRIICQGITVQNRRWNFLPINDVSKKVISFKKFRTQILDFKQKFKVPDFVLYVNFDNKLPVNFDDTSLYRIYKMWKKNPIAKVRLEEVSSKLFNKNYYEEEAVCTLYSPVKEYNRSIEDKVEYNSVYPVNVDKNWIYINLIFADKDYQNSFIKSKLLTLFSKVDKYAEKQFFIQYETDKNLPTIRYRVKINDYKNYFSVMGLLLDFLTNEVKNETLKNFAFENYFPEIYRYGGKQYISDCESIFAIDSRLSLYAYNTLNNYIDRQALLVYSSNAYILSRSVDIKENLNFIKYFDTQDKKDANKWFRENKDKVSSFEADSYINSLIQDRSIILRRLMTTSQISDDQKDEILLSLLHMSANRLIGVDRVLENRLMLATTNLIKANFYKHNV